MIAQALSYEEKHGMDLEEFFKATEDAFTEEPFIGWAKQVREKRLLMKQSKLMSA